MKSNLILKIVLACLTLTLVLLSFGCQSAPSGNEISRQEDEMQEDQSQPSNKINEGSSQKEQATSESSESLTFEEKTIFVGPE